MKRTTRHAGVAAGDHGEGVEHRHPHEAVQLRLEERLAVLQPGRARGRQGADGGGHEMRLTRQLLVGALLTHLQTHVAVLAISRTHVTKQKTSQL